MDFTGPGKSAAQFGEAGPPARLKSLRHILDSDGTELPASVAAADARDEVLPPLEELHDTRHGMELPDGNRGLTPWGPQT
ncbi:hypothetical protein GCM10011583_73820 [Streptomyces camponoticapitis]|uniref:Uncharacterized protein n=1 Tax=Streptomyces camponoticapitis TaxID=1616125 RepID=A0ABQ2EXK9_9ACTN|nr:hypothetical protein GCM10011583_73820 [Streptomyces camponoticapitis]